MAAEPRRREGADGRRLAGKVALISGAARGQGAEHAKRFAEEGASVVLADVLDERARRQREPRRPRPARPLRPPRRDQDADWKAAVALAEERFGKLDVLVNNAGILGMPSILEETEEHWNQVIAVKPDRRLPRDARGDPAMQRAGGGSIINTSSIWGLVGAEEYIAYQATKGAVALMSKSAALTHVGDGIRVNSVCPGSC